MTQGERVKEVRKALNLTLEKFGEKIGSKKNTMSAIETGRNALTDLMAKSICREFNVNYDWLMYGDGEMFSNLPQTILDELCRQYGMDDEDKSLIEFYLTLDAGCREALKKHIRETLLHKKDSPQ